MNSLYSGFIVLVDNLPFVKGCNSCGKCVIAAGKSWGEAVRSCPTF